MLRQFQLPPWRIASPPKIRPFRFLYYPVFWRSAARRRHLAAQSVTRPCDECSVPFGSHFDRIAPTLRIRNGHHHHCAGGDFKHSRIPRMISYRAVGCSGLGGGAAFGHGDNSVQVWDALTGGNVFTNRGHTSDVNGIAWSPDSKYIVSASNDKTAQVWQPK